MKKYAVSLIFTRNQGKFIHNELYILTSECEEIAIIKAKKYASKKTKGFYYQGATALEIISNDKATTIPNDVIEKYNLQYLNDVKTALEEALYEIPKSCAGHLNPSHVIIKNALNNFIKDAKQT